MSQLVAIKGLYDLYYSENNDYLKPLIVKTLTNALSTSKDEYILLTIKNVLSSLSMFIKDFSVPDFTLLDKNKRNVSLSDFKNDFVYLNFVDLSSKAGFQYFELLKRYDDSKIKKLNIVTVLVCSSFEEFKNFLKQYSQYRWTFLYAPKNDKIIQNYNVQNFPAFFLINPEKKLSVDYTPNPAENFEEIYNKSYTEWLEYLNNTNQKKLYEGNN
jgi:hypothetical protein